jgi:hypothetical protein
MTEEKKDDNDYPTIAEVERAIDEAKFKRNYPDTSNSCPKFYTTPGGEIKEYHPFRIERISLL